MWLGVCVGTTTMNKTCGGGKCWCWVGLRHFGTGGSNTVNVLDAALHERRINDRVHNGFTRFEPVEALCCQHHSSRLKGVTMDIINLSNKIKAISF